MTILSFVLLLICDHCWSHAVGYRTAACADALRCDSKQVWQGEVGHRIITFAKSVEEVKSGNNYYDNSTQYVFNKVSKFVLGMQEIPACLTPINHIFPLYLNCQDICVSFLKIYNLQTE